MSNPRYRKQSVLSNLEYRHKLLKEEVRDLVLSFLPEDQDIEFEMTDYAGNEIETISRTRIIGDNGHTYYPFDELKTGELLQIAERFINQLPTEDGKEDIQN